jgi:N-carbamoyl-L-amino-acid hydrolase
MATAELITAMERSWRRIEDAGGDLVITFGQLGTYSEAHSLITILGLVRFTFDARSHTKETLDRVPVELRRLAEKIGRRRDVEFAFQPFTGAAPAHKAPEIRRRLKRRHGSPG